MRQILISAEKVEKRGTRIREVEFDDDEEPAANVIPAPIARQLRRGNDARIAAVSSRPPVTID